MVGLSKKDKEYFLSVLTDTFSHLDRGTLEKLYSFFELLWIYNDQYDLSRLKKIEDMVYKHFVDSVIIPTLVPLPDSTVDIGTGAGFPGIPIKIVQPELRLVLAEPRPMRCTFMNMVIDKLELTGTTVFPHKVNEMMRFDVESVITRAFESVPATLDRTINFLPKGGKILFLKGPGVDDELEEISGESHSSFKKSDDIDYTLPGTAHKRRLVVFEKTSSFKKLFFPISDIPELSRDCVISSKENKRYKQIKKVIMPGGTKKTGLTVVSGKKICIELITKRPELVDSLIVYEDYTESDQELVSLIDSLEKEEKLLLLKKGLYNEIDTGNSKLPLLICKTPEFKPLSELDSTKAAILLPFQDPENTGSVTRSATAFGINQIVMTPQSCSPFHPKAVRASGGAVFFTTFFSGPSLDDLETKINQPIVALDKRGNSLYSADIPENPLIVPGIEGPGLPEKYLPHALSIPIDESVESLNAAVSTSIILYEMRRQHANKK